MKKIKLKIIGVLIGVFIVLWAVYAINTTSTWYKLNHWWHSYISSKDVAFKNTHSSYNYFVPTKTSTEYNAFAAHLPSWVSKITESYSRSSSCAPWWTMWLRLYQHNWASYAVQWSVNWVFWNYWNTDIDFKWPVYFNWKTLYRGSWVKRKWNCQANVDVYKVIVVN